MCAGNRTGGSNPLASAITGINQNELFMSSFLFVIGCVLSDRMLISCICS